MGFLFLYTDAKRLAFLDAGIVGAQGKVLFYFEVQNFKKGFRIYR